MRLLNRTPQLFTKIVATFLLIALLPLASAKTLKVMSYNIQNLFDNVANPVKDDDDFLLGGDQAWSEFVINMKIKHLSDFIKEVNPDVIGISEVESQEMLEALLDGGYKNGGLVEAANNLKSFGYKYYSIDPYSVQDADKVDGEPDHRGIQNAIISKLPIVEYAAGVNYRSHVVYDSAWENMGYPYTPRTRDIFEATVEVEPGKEVTFLVNHWPSRSRKENSATMRLHAAKELQRITNDILKSNPKRMVVSLGDFNDDYNADGEGANSESFNNKSMMQGMNVKDSEGEAFKTVGAYFAPALKTAFDKRKSYFWHGGKSWNSLDHIMIASGDKPFLSLVNGSYKRTIGKKDYQGKSFEYALGSELPYWLQGKPPADKDRLIGPSDHWPVVVAFKVGETLPGEAEEVDPWKNWEDEHPVVGDKDPVVEEDPWDDLPSDEDVVTKPKKRNKRVVTERVFNEDGTVSVRKVITYDLPAK